MANEAIDARATCPFYRAAKKNRIKCEGAIDGTITSLVFADEELAAAYAEARCCDSFKNCPVFRMTAGEIENE